MKKLAYIFLLNSVLLGLVAGSCTQTPAAEPVPEPDKEDPNPDPEPDPEPDQPETYYFVASPMQGSWKAGDQIYVHGNIGTETEIITLAAGDISADGKTASAKLSGVTASPAEPDGLYAAWPAEAVYLFKGVLKVKTTFEQCDRLLTISYLDKDTFNFIDVSAQLSFKVSGDYDNYAIAGNDRAGLNITKFDAEYSSQKKAFNPKKNDGYPFLYGSVTAGSPVQIWFPGDFSFAKGYTIYLAKGDKWTASYTVEEAVTLTSGQVTDLGDITAKIQAYEGLAPRMPRQGAETRYKVEFNELSGICLSADGDFIWAVGDDGELAKLTLEGGVIESHYISGDAEAISRNPETGDLLIGMEPDGVGIIYAPDFKGHTKTLFSVAKAKNYGNAGIEGLTYYKDGMIYAGSQTDSRLFCIELATGTVLWDKAMYDKQCVSEIADLCYDPLTDWLWIMDSERKMILVFNGDTTQFLGAYSVSGSNPESVFVDHMHSCVWVGDDYGNPSYLYRYDFTGLDDANIAQ